MVTLEYDLDGFIMKRFLVFFFVMFSINILAVKADIVKEPVCMSGGQIVSCPDFVPNQKVENKNNNVEHYYVAPVKYNKHHKPKIKRKRYRYGFIQPAYADIVQPAYADIVDPAYADIQQNKVLYSIILFVLIVASIFFVKGRRNENNN